MKQQRIYFTTIATLLVCLFGFVVVFLCGGSLGYAPLKKLLVQPGHGYDSPVHTDSPPVSLLMAKADTEEDNTVDETVPTTTDIGNNENEEYWFNGKIHTLGNTGIGGGAHAAVGALSTKIIDNSAYEGRDVRQEVANELAQRVIMELSSTEATKGNISACQILVLDMCCGVGMSTRALKNAFDNATDTTIGSVSVTGVDTSPEMIEMSDMLTIQEQELKKGRNVFGNLKYFWKKSIRRLKRPINRQIEATDLSNITFYVGNAESTPFPDESFDLITVFYSFHEVPYEGRQTIIGEARRLLRTDGIFAVVDISQKYQPSKAMLSGEPYVLEYQKNINNQLKFQNGFKDFSNKVIIEGHVELWQLVRV